MWEKAVLLKYMYNLILVTSSVQGLMTVSNTWALWEKVGLHDVALIAHDLQGYYGHHVWICYLLL